MTRSILRALALLLLLPALAATTATAAPPTHHIEREGIAIDVTLEPVTGTAPLREGDDVHVRIEVRDTHTGAPISTLEPAGWMDILPAGPETDPNACKAKVQGFLGGSLLSIPSLDLNVFYVLAMNDNATISVVDPLFGFGGSKLLTMILLDSPGEDWVLSKDASELYVSMPLSNAVAVVDTATWKVRGNIEVGPGPTRLVLGDDGRLLWVAYAGAAAGASSGVSAIDLTKGQEIARLEIGVGAVELALADDGRRLFASSAGSADVAVVDTRAQTLLAKTPVGGHPVSLGASALAGAVWVADKDGALVALDAHTGAVRSRLEIEPGISQIRFTR